MLRSLLGWLHVAGEIPVPLAWAVPAVTTWRLAALPSPLEPGQVTAMLAGVIRARPPAGATWRCSRCWRGSGCEPARSPP